MTDLKKCPYCAEEIRLEAIKCRYCGSSLTSRTPLRDWTRRDDDRMLAGVCSGLAARVEVPPTVVRLAFVIAAIFSGFAPALILYGVLWVIMPLEQPLYDDYEAIDEGR